MQYCKNCLDNSLFNLLSQEEINKTAISELITKGVNVNAVDDDSDYSLLYTIISNTDDDNEKDTEVIKMLLDKGADIHYVNTSGHNCLFAASVPWRANIFKMLLEKGVNPNWLSTEYPHESQLDEMECFEYHCVRDTNEFNEKEKRTYKIMIRILKRYGAKNYYELNTETLKKYLIIFAGYHPTGLVTWDGFIKIQNLPNITSEIVAAFNTWRESDPYPYNNLTEGKEYIKNIELLREFNNQGMELARKIKETIVYKATIHYFSVETEDPVMRFRDLHHSII